MSDPGFSVFVLEDGRRVKVPAQNAQKFMRRLDDDGVKFHSDDAPGFDAPAPPQAAAPPPPQPSALEHLASMARGAGQTLYDGAVGASQGATMGTADELGGAMPWTSVDEQQQIARDARGRSPIAYDAGNAAGSMIPLALSGGGSALVQFAKAALQGGAGAFLGTDGDLQERSHQGLKGIGIGAGLSVASGAAAKGLGALEGAADSVGDSARSLAFSTPGKFKIEGRKMGVDYPAEQLPKEAERLGLTNTVIPQSAAGYEARAGAAKQAAGAAEGAALQDAAEQGVRGDKRVIQQGLNDLRAEAAQNSTSDRQKVPPVYDQMVNNLEQDIWKTRDPGATLQTPRAYGGRSPWDVSEGPATPDQVRGSRGPELTEMTPLEILALKKQYEAKGGFVSDEIKNTPQGMEQTAYQNASNVPREHLQDTMWGAEPETREAFDNNRRNFSFLATIENLAKESALHHAAHLLGPAEGLGVALGAEVGHMVGHGPIGALAGYALGRAGKVYGPDATANLMNGAEGAFGFGADMTSGAGPGLGMMAGQETARRANAEQAKNERERLAGAGKGHEIENVARQALQSDPSVLGQYAQQFEEAQQDEDPMRMTALIASLSEDPKFRMTVLPRLQQMSNPQGGY